ncbi:proline-rich protein 33 [Spea bombifrons]|uniref:proline-rich protein 33 n=1 Tax=Spea bombifrons TaxID=233779 RepID=UPI00234A36C4|nr:proline-rich protein 33 [Spea bombifrons]
MLLTVTPLENPGPPSPAPPPTAPKPNKDNARLQRLLRKAAKRGGVQHPSSQPPKSFRSTLSPVSEADLESLESTTPKKHGPPPLTLPPRFQIRTVTHRVPSPYPKNRSFTFTVSEQHSLSQYLTSPPPYETPSPRPVRGSTPTTSTDGQPASTTPKLFPQIASKHSTTLSTEAPRLKNRNESSSPHPAISELQGTLNGTSTHAGAEVLSPNIKGNKDNDQNSGVATNTETRYFTTEPGNTDSGMNTSILTIGTVAESPSPPKSGQEGTTQKPTSCSYLSSEKTPASVISPTPMFTEKSELLSLSSKVADIPHISLTVDSGPIDISKTHKSPTSADICNTASPLSSGVTQRTVTQVIKSPSPYASTPVTPVPAGSPYFEKLPSTEELGLLKNPERVKPPRRKPGGGWARLVKHLVVEPDEPKFPELQRTEGKEEKAGGDVGMTTEGQQQSRGSRANKMWDALLYHMATSNKQQEKTGPVSDVPPPLPFLRSRLPLLLHRPRFDARKLKEAASRPLRRVTAFFHRRSNERPLSSFNRTASGWSIRGEDAEQLVGEGDGQENGTM